MRACWAATLLVLVPPSPASCATCTGTSVVPRVLALTHRHLHKSPCVRQPFAGISGNTAFSSLWFLSRKLCPILCVTSRVHSICGVNPLDGTVFCEHGWRCLANFRGTPSLDSFRVADDPPGMRRARTCSPFVFLTEYPAYEGGRRRI